MSASSYLGMLIMNLEFRLYVCQWFFFFISARIIDILIL